MCYFKNRTIPAIVGVMLLFVFPVLFSLHAEDTANKPLELLTEELEKLETEGVTLERLETLGSLYSTLEDYRNAAQVLHMAVEMDNATVETTLQLVNIYVEAGKGEGALSILEEASKEFPKSKEVLMELGTAYIAFEKIQPALVTLQRAAKIDPTDPNIQYRLAEAWFHYGNFSQAENVLLPLMDADTVSQETVLLYGHTLLETGSSRKGIRRVEKLYKADSENKIVRDALVSMLLRNATIEGNAGRLSRAIKGLEKAHDIVPEDKDILLGLALFQNQLGDALTAIQYCQDILKLDPNELKAYMFLGRLQRMEGLSTFAERTFEKGLQKAIAQNDQEQIELFKQLLNPLN